MNRASWMPNGAHHTGDHWQLTGKQTAELVETKTVVAYWDRRPEERDLWNRVAMEATVEKRDDGAAGPENKGRLRHVKLMSASRLEGKFVLSNAIVPSKGSPMGLAER